MNVSQRTTLEIPRPFVVVVVVIEYSQADDNFDNDYDNDNDNDNDRKRYRNICTAPLGALLRHGMFLAWLMYLDKPTRTAAAFAA
jgi:hypothetical protein